MMTTHPFNALAIGQYTQALNNRLNCYFNGINAIQKVKSFFLVGNNSSFQSKKPISVETSVKVRTKYAVKTVFLMRTNHCMGLNFKSRFIESIKRRMGKQIPPISGINLKDYFLSNLASFSRQVAITQAEKLVFSFLDCFSIRSINSWGKRISLRFDLLVSFAILIIHKLLIRAIYTKTKSKNSVDMCGQNKIYCTDTFEINVLIKTIAQRVCASMSYLTTITLTEVMIMANRYDSAHLCARQSKLYKFYDLLTAQVVQTTAKTEHQARKNLGKSSLIFIARIRLYPVIERARSFGGYSHE
nr:host cell division inhibitor Icd-like protein [Gilliamella sp.]